MNRRANRADFFDASALVKIYANEPHSDVVRSYFHSRPTKYTSPFCFYEALNILKSKWLNRSQMTRDEYLDAAFRLTAWYAAATKRINDLDFTDPLVFGAVKSLVERTGVDLSDAFQIVSVKSEVIGPRAANRAEETLWRVVVAVWQAGRWCRARPMEQWCVLPA
jgi:predicted nucleic acid-binding protein